MATFAEFSVVLARLQTAVTNIEAEIETLRSAPEVPDAVMAPLQTLAGTLEGLVPAPAPVVPAPAPAEPGAAPTPAPVAPVA